MFNTKIIPSMTVRSKAFGLVLGFLALSSIGYWFALDVKTPLPVPQEKNIEGKERVYFGVISRYSPRSIIAGYQPLMDYLSDNTPYHFNLRLSRTYLETVRQLSEGEVDFASLGNFTYINAHKTYGFKCIAMPLNANGTLDNFDDIIVRSDSPIQSIEELKGKSFAFASRQSFSAWIAIWMLDHAGISFEDLSKYDYLSHHDVVAEKVLRGDYDAGMVKTIVAQDYLDKGIRVLKRSPAIPSVPLVVANQVDSAKTKSVLTVLLSLSDRINSGEVSTQGWDREVAYGYERGNDSLYYFPRSILEELTAKNILQNTQGFDRAD
jgi:phosphonate transport system substrate-binding protein